MLKSVSDNPIKSDSKDNDWNIVFAGLGIKL